MKSAKSEKRGEKVKRRDAVPGGHGGTSEQADAASGPVPKHPGPGPPPSIIFPPHLVWSCSKAPRSRTRSTSLHQISSPFGLVLRLGPTLIFEKMPFLPISGCLLAQ